MSVALSLALALPMAVGDPVAADYSVFATAILIVLGGLAAALGLVVAGALGIRAITWGVPKLVKFFTRLA